MKTLEKISNKPIDKQLNIEEMKNLQNQNMMLIHQVEELTAKLNWYEEQFRLNQERRFGKSSEKTVPDQLSLFNEAEKESRPEKEEPTIEEITYKCRKSKGLNKKSFEDLPVETIEYSLSEEERVCPTCNSHLHEMSKEIRRELKVIPAQVVVVEHVQNIYACRNCEKENISTPIITAKMPTSKSYMWLYATGVYSNPIFLYEYQPSRAKKHPKKFLKGFNGFLQTDAYPGYNAVEDVTLVVCFAHARRGCICQPKTGSLAILVMTKMENIYQ